MIENTPLANTIEAADLKTRYDNASKNLTAQKPILAWIMKECITEFKNVSIDDIQHKYINGEPTVAKIGVLPDTTNLPTAQIQNTELNSIKEGKVTFDILVYAITPTKKPIKLIINVETQNKSKLKYPIIKRAIYYCSRMISAQHGSEFVSQEYQKIKKVYSIWLCNNPGLKYRNTITRYKIQEEQILGNYKNKQANYELLEVIIVNLTKANQAKNNNIIKLMSVIFSDIIKAETKKKILQKDFGIPMTNEIEREVTEMCNLSDGIEEKGLKKGVDITRIEVIKKLMKKYNQSLEEALDFMDLTEKEKKHYRHILTA